MRTEGTLAQPCPCAGGHIQGAPVPCCSNVLLVVMVLAVEVAVEAELELNDGRGTSLPSDPSFQSLIPINSSP